MERLGWTVRDVFHSPGHPGKQFSCWVDPGLLTDLLDLQENFCKCLGDSLMHLNVCKS